MAEISIQVRGMNEGVMAGSSRTLQMVRLLGISETPMCSGIFDGCNLGVR